MADSKWFANSHIIHSQTAGLLKLKMTTTITISKNALMLHIKNVTGTLYGVWELSQICVMISALYKFSCTYVSNKVNE